MDIFGSQNIKIEYLNKLNFGLLIGISLLINSCGENREEKLLRLAQKYNEEQCIVDSLFELSESEWNETMDFIRNSDNLMVEEPELDLILSTRNGELLKMFRSYDHFPKVLQDRIVQMEERDHEIADLIVLSQKKKMSLQDSIYEITSAYSNWNERERVTKRINKQMNALCQ